jgi:hypothetical protein
LFEISDRVDERGSLREYFDRLRGIVGFNSHRFDDHITYMALLSEASPAEMAARADAIIDGSYEVWGSPLEFPVFNLDLMKIAPGSLKELGIRLGCPALRELPIRPGSILSHTQMDQIRKYNINDLVVTAELFHAVRSEIDMRVSLVEQTGIQGLLSEREPSIGARVMKQRYGRGFWMPRESRKLLDEWSFSGSDVLDPRVSFSDPALRQVRDQIAGLALTYRTAWSEPDNGGKPKKKMIRPEVSIAAQFAGTHYSVGIGGLHSVDRPGRFVSTADVMIVDVDVSSFYPSIILNLALCPRRLDPKKFLGIYRDLRTERLAAKAAGQDAAATGLKISINSIFGKTAEPYSVLCDPKIMTSVTVNGQMYLLALAERVTAAGAVVLSANTDGLTLAVLRNDDRWSHAVDIFAAEFNFEFDRVEYAVYARRDVNNYCARTASGKIKAKGDYLSVARDLRHKGGHRIVSLAAQRCLLEDVPVSETVHGCTDLLAFLDYFKASQGWTVIDQDGEPLPRINRWYESVNGQMLYKVREDGTGKTKLDGVRSAVLVPDLPEGPGLPPDLDLDVYIAAAQKLVDAVLVAEPEPERAAEPVVVHAAADEIAVIPDGQQTFWFTDVPGVQDNRIPNGGSHALPWSEFAARFSEFHISEDKADVPMFVPARFRDPTDPEVDPVVTPQGGLVLDGTTGLPYVRRCAANVLEYSALVADIDGEQTIKQIERRLRDRRFILYTTHSSYRKGNGERFRVVLPFILECPTAVFQVLASEFLALIGASDRSQVSASRAFYVPSCPASHKSLARLIVQDGALLDWRDFLPVAEARLIQEAERAAERQAARAAEVQDRTPEDEARMRQTLLTRLKGHYVGYEPVWAKVATAMAREGFGIDDFIRVSVDGLMKQKSPEDCRRKWEAANRNIARDLMNGLDRRYLWNVTKGLHDREHR